MVHKVKVYSEYSSDGCCSYCTSITVTIKYTNNSSRWTWHHDCNQDKNWIWMKVKWMNDECASEHDYDVEFVPYSDLCTDL